MTHASSPENPTDPSQPTSAQGPARASVARGLAVWPTPAMVCLVGAAWWAGCRRICSPSRGPAGALGRRGVLCVVRLRWLVDGARSARHAAASAFAVCRAATALAGPLARAAHPGRSGGADPEKVRRFYGWEDITAVSLGEYSNNPKRSSWDPPMSLPKRILADGERRPDDPAWQRRRRWNQELQRTLAGCDFDHGCADRSRTGVLAERIGTLLTVRLRRPRPGCQPSAAALREFQRPAAARS